MHLITLAIIFLPCSLHPTSLPYFLLCSMMTVREKETTTGQTKGVAELSSEAEVVSCTKSPTPAPSGHMTSIKAVDRKAWRRKRKRRRRMGKLLASPPRKRKIWARWNSRGERTGPISWQQYIDLSIEADH